MQKLEQQRREEQLKESCAPVAELNERQVRSQLASAIFNSDVARISEIFEYGNACIARPPDSMSTWLGEAISQNCDIAILEKLLSEGCEPNDESKSGGSTPLEEAVAAENFPAIELLLEHGADPNKGRPIVGAIHYEKSPAVQLKLLGILVAHGASLNQRFDLFGNAAERFTVLDWAELYGSSDEVLTYLKDKGAENEWSRAQLQQKQKNLKK